MDVMALFNAVDWLVVMIDPRSWGIAAIAVFAWRPYHWPRRLLVALTVYLLLAIVIEWSIYKTFFGPRLYSQFMLGLIATAIWFAILQRVRLAFAAEN